MNAPSVFTVGQITSLLKKILEKEFAVLAVRGEVSNLKEQTSGHVYFTLKDAEAQISAVFFRGDIAKELKKPLKNGEEIVVRGELSVYPPKGGYQIIVRKVEFAGIGALLLKLHDLKIELGAKGLFDPVHKKKLPPYPKVIGVITSPTGAVIQDILNVLSRRFSGFQLILNPVKVQGEDAAKEIAQAIIDMNRFKLADVLIVGRGGGSLEDLWAFNEKIVVEAIFASQIPIVTAIGHETDTCLADFAADIRAPTPSAAAEIVMAEKVGQLQFLKTTRKALVHVMSMKLNEHKIKVRNIEKHPSLVNVSSVLSGFYQKIDDIQNRIDQQMIYSIDRQKQHLRRLNATLQAQNPLTLLSQNRRRLESIEKTLHPLLLLTLRQKKERLERLKAHLSAIDPRNLLTKGYSILFRENTNSVIVSAQDVQEGESLLALLHDGTLKLKKTL